MDIGAPFAPDPLGLPLGLGLRASAPPPRYSLHHRFSGVALAMPKRSIASGLAIPSLTTALAAATLVSKSYLACSLPIFSRPSLQVARRVFCQSLAASAGTPSPLATNP